jgi:hypothetical protein
MQMTEKTKTKTKKDQPSNATLARRRNAGKRREAIVRTGRRIDLLLTADPAAALAAIEARTGERPTAIIGRLLVEEAAG